MSRVLFAVWPFTGCVHPQIAVASHLARRGHAAAFYTGAQHQRLLEEQGFDFFPFQHELEKAVQNYVLSPHAIGLNWSRPWRLRPQIRGLFAETVPLQVRDLGEILTGWKPDAIVTDPAMWGPFLILSELRSIPVAILSYACGCMLSGPDAPPMGLGLPIARSVAGKLRNRVAGWGLDWFLSDTRSKAAALRREFGLSELCGPVIDLARRLPLYLVPSSPEFDYERRDLPDSVKYVGPLQWYPPDDSHAILDSLPAHSPWIHVTEGTLHVRDSFLLRAAAEGLASMPVQVIAGVFDSRTPDECGINPVPANMRLVKWINHRELLPRTSVMVTTGGGGTVMAGMQHGVPLVVVPTEWDKAENAQRVVEAGAGIRLAPRQCTPGRLRSALEEILHNECYRRNARRIASSLAGRGGPERAAGLVEDMLGRPQHTTDSLVGTGSEETSCRFP